MQFYVTYIRDAIPNTVGWSLKPHCQEMLEILPSLQDALNIDGITLGTSHITLTFDHDNGRVELWSDKLPLFGIQYWRKQWINTETPVVNPSQVIPMLQDYLSRLRREQIDPPTDQHLSSALKDHYAQLPPDQVSSTAYSAILDRLLETPIHKWKADWQVSKQPPPPVSSKENQALLDRMIEIIYILEAASEADKINKIRMIDKDVNSR